MYKVKGSLSVKSKLGVGTENPLSTCDIVGSEGKKIKVINQDYTLSNRDSIVIVQETTEDIEITLPNTDYCSRRVHYIVNESDFKVTCSCVIDDVFYNGTSVELTTKGTSIQLAAYKGWHILSKFIP